ALPRRLAGGAAAGRRTAEHLRAVRPPRRRLGDVRPRAGAGAGADRAVAGVALGRGPADGRLRVRLRARLAAERGARGAARQPAAAAAGAAGAILSARRTLILAFVLTAAVSARAGAADVRVDDLCRGVIEDSNYKVRVQAALVLGKLGDPKAVQPLIKALGDQNKSVRGIAASALGQLGDAAAVDPLRDLLRRESDPFV